jgi:hypothetical protein
MSVPSTSRQITRSEGCTPSAAGAAADADDDEDDEDEEDDDEDDKDDEEKADAEAEVGAGGTKAMKRHVPSEVADCTTPNWLVPKPPQSQPYGVLQRGSNLMVRLRDVSKMLGAAGWVALTDERVMSHVLTFAPLVTSHSQMASSGTSGMTMSSD